jgi:hypothetical protein
MSKFSLQVSLKASNGNTMSYITEVQLPDHLDSKITNSSYKDEVLAALSGVLPQMLGGSDWRRNGSKLVSFNSPRKI